MIKTKKKYGYIKKIVLSIMTVFILILFLEVVARIIYPFYSNYNTEMVRYTTMVKQVSDNPKLSHEHRPNSSARLYGVNIEVNSDGFRDNEYSVKKDKNTFRILALGDSITFGWGVEFNHTFSEILEQRLNKIKPLKKYKKYEVINAGIGNYNIAMKLALLKEKGLKYDPDLILLQYYLNDVEISEKKSKLNILRYSYFYAFLWDKFQNVKLRLFRGNDYKTYYMRLYEDNVIDKEMAKKSLYELIGISKEKKIKILIVIFPEFHNYEDYQFSKATEFVFEIANSLDVPVLDLLPYYINYDPESIWVSYEDAHPNILGHKIAAKYIYEKLIEEEYVK